MANENHTPEDRPKSKWTYSPAQREALNARRRAAYASNPEKHREAAAKWQRDNADKVSKKNAAYWEANRDKLLDRQKANYQESADARRAYARTYIAANKDRYREHHLARYRNDPEGQRARAQAYRDANPEKFLASAAAWRAANKGHAAKRYAEDRDYRLICLLRARLRAAIKAAKAARADRTLALVGCTLAELVEHIEARFQPGMSWDNHGFRGWHIDHIRPCASFLLSDPEQQRACFHYLNLQPLWAEDNLRKSAKFPAL